MEEDLAALFGRGRVSPDIEQKFKEIVKESKMRINPIFPGSQFVLDSGPGLTVIRAFQDQYYLAAVITLSMLTYFHSQNVPHNTSIYIRRNSSMPRLFCLSISDTADTLKYHGFVHRYFDIHRTQFSFNLTSSKLLFCL